MNITTLIITALVSSVTGAIAALRYGVSIAGMVKADIAMIHAKIDSAVLALKVHAATETAKVTAKVDSVVAEANADEAKLKAKADAVISDLAK
jgi:hypothetical protein